MIVATRSKKKKTPNARRAERGPQQVAANPLTVQNPGLACLLLACITFVVYARTLRNGFIDYDDRVYVTENAHVQSGLSANTLRWAFTTFDNGNWHPLTWISHALDEQVFASSAAAVHFHSVLLHALNAILLFFVLWKVSGSQARSFVVAALFAVHPLNVEAVAWAAERKTVLSAFFFFLALGAYGWYAKQPSLKRYALLVILFVFGLMSKPMVITLPFVLLLLDYWPLRRIELWTTPREPWVASQKTSLNLVAEKIPLFILCAASAVITVLAQKHANAVATLSETPILWRMENAIRSYARYLFKAVWPVNLSAFYPQTNPSPLGVILAVLVLLAIGIWVWRERKSKPYLIVGWLWFVGTLVPVIGLVQVGLQAMADRFAYTPLIGIFVMVVWSAADAAKTIPSKIPLRVTAAIVLLFFSALTYRQIGFWQNPISIWTHAIEVTRDNIIAEDSLTTALMDLGRYDEARQHIENAIRLNSTEPRAHITLAFLRMKQGDPHSAIEQCQVALSLTKDPEILEALYDNLGAAYMQTSDYTAANASFQRALKLDPSNATAMLYVGRLALMQSAQRLEQELSRDPTADGFNQLGNLWEQSGDDDRARRAYQSALALDPKSSAAQTALQQLQHSTK
jgi:protein O-mannosyl-transferase